MDTHLAFHFAPEDCVTAGAKPVLRLHLGVCGSIAAYRSLDLVRQWQDAGFGVSVTLTPAAMEFVGVLSFEALGASPVYAAMSGDPRISTPFPHLEPGQNVRAMIIAPASAATIARLAQGGADALLACQALAFRGPLVIAPAMNPAMWEHPAVQANAALLRSRGCLLVPPALGRTACGEQGRGRMADVRLVYLAGLRGALPKDFVGVKALITLGPTREPWDGVRFWTNASTGVMGASLALALWLRGAEVHAICGPGTPWLPAAEDIPDAPMYRYNVTSAREMFAIASELWPEMDIGLFTAAVADYSPVPSGAEKFKKSDAPDGFDLHFAPNPDILKTLAASRRQIRPQKVMGFAAESGNLQAAVYGKLRAKQADMLVGNLLSDGFATSSDKVFVVDRLGREEAWPQLPKPAIAWRLVSWLASL